MKKTFLIRLSAGMLVLGGAWVAYTQNNAKAPPELKINKVFDDLYEIEGDGGTRLIHTVRGVGYSLRAPVEVA